MRKWIDFVAMAALASVGVIGNLLINRGDPIPDHMILSFFAAGITSSVILTKTKCPSNIGNPPSSLRRGGVVQQGEEEPNIVAPVRRLAIPNDQEMVKGLVGHLCETAQKL